MTTIELIGVPFDGYGRPGNQARAAAALRSAGLLGAFAGCEIVSTDIELPAQTGERAAGSGLMNERALLALVDQLYDRVRESLTHDRFPVVYGADCSVLLGIVPALRDVAGRAGLLFVDGHEDATTISGSPDGEVANMEIAMLLGLTKYGLPDALSQRLPALQLPALAMLGQRDEEWRRLLGVPSLVDRAVLLRDARAVAADPAQHAREAVKHIASTASHWWLHVDLDVLSGDDFSARGESSEGREDPPLPGGLDWQQLTELVGAAFAAGGCAGWSVVIYNPDRDPDGAAGRRIVRFVADIAPFIAARNTR